MQKIFRIGLGLVISLSLISFFQAKAWAVEYYVSPSGSDSNPGTLDRPFKTISGNMWRMTAGNTMYLRGGEYPEDININNSGTLSAPIVFKAYQNEQPVITGNPNRSGASQGIYVYDKDYVVFDGIDIKNFRGHWMSIWLSSHITVKNCNFTNVTMNIIGFLIMHSDHITIQNCVMDKVSDPTVTQDKDLLLLENTHYSLLENLTLSRGPHTLISLQNSQYNVIRNNVLKNDWQKNLSLAAPANQNLGRNLIENNQIFGSRPAILPGFTGKGAMGIFVNQKGNIIRRNSVYDNSNFGLLVSGNNALGDTSVTNNYIYHNVIHKNGLLKGYDASAGISFTTFGFNHSVGNNVVKNNIISENERANIYVSSNNRGLENNQFSGNCFYKPVNPSSDISVVGIGNNMLSVFQTNYNTLFSANLQVNPGFVAAGIVNPDFRLTSSSPCINSGVALTKTRTAGSGTQVPVEDANYFSDGFGVVQGDTIVVGNSGPVKVTKVDYAANTLTVERSLTWSVGVTVAQPFNGDAPDAGVYETAAGTTGGSLSDLLATPVPSPVATVAPSPSGTLLGGLLGTNPPPQAAVAGDSNDDGLVTGADYAVWLKNAGKETAQGYKEGDFNADKKVDQLDFDIWKARFSL